jgi:2-aminobenzoate-CoA ligase
MASAHVDTFARDNLPCADEQPEFVFDLPELRFPAQLNCVDEFVDRWVRAGEGDRVCIRAEGAQWTYAQLQERANRIANVLVHDMALVPGNRVLVRSANKPMLAACLFAVMKAGGVVVPTMPLLRSKELGQIISKARVSHALCDEDLAPELEAAARAHPELRNIRCFGGGSPEHLEALMQRQSAEFENVHTACDDTCLIAFTSGTTGLPKATMHFHRDLLAACHCWPKHVLRLDRADVVVGSPPLAFTFGLGGLLLFPLHAGACAVLVAKAGPKELLDAIVQFGATVLFTAPTSYRALAVEAGVRRVSIRHGGTLRKCVSAGEALSVANRALWREHTGVELIDGIGSTEMLHIFISADGEHAKPGATGCVVPGYRARVVDDHGEPVPVGTIGRLAVQGPTGCRYLADERQGQYVRAGWNYTGDAYRMDADGYFHYESRTDDMIVSAGYNIAATDVEDALVLHPQVLECAVIGIPDQDRGQIVKAFVVLREPRAAGAGLARELQEFVKGSIAPYKYPRAIEFRSELPRTATGKLQRFSLREPLIRCGGPAGRAGLGQVMVSGDLAANA